METNNVAAEIAAEIARMNARRPVLEAAFNRVCDAERWKNPIRKIVTIERFEDSFQVLKDIEDAVIFFTGSVATITEVSATKRQFLVVAAGYYRTIGA